MSNDAHSGIRIVVLIGLYFVFFCVLQYLIGHWDAAFPPPSLIGR